MTTTKQYLREMEDLLTNPSHWTKEVAARDRDGKPVYANSEHAVCWCLQGAATKVAGVSGKWPQLMDVLQRGLSCSLPVFNDRSTHKEVLAHIRSLKEVA